MVPKDLRKVPPRRWSDELGGIRWLPRMIDKARAAIGGTLGDYLYGQSPMDRGLLRALGLNYREFTNIVRASNDSDDAVLHALKKEVPDGIGRAREWSRRLPQRHRLFLFLIDVDDGYGAGWQALRGFIRFFMGLWARYTRFHWPARGSLIGLEVDAQKAGARAKAASGAEEEPYRWLTAHNVDMAWKILLSVVLIGVMFYYIILFIQRIGIVAMIIIAAIFFAYLIYPIIRWLNGKLPLILAILVVYVCLLGLVALGLYYLIPVVGGEITTLTRDWPSIQNKIQAFITNPNTPLLGHAPAGIRQELSHLPQQIVRWLQTHGGGAASSALGVILGTAAFLGAIVVTPILAAYLLYDSEIIKRFFMGFIPEQHRDATLDLLAELEEVVGGFIRGQILVGASVGLLIAIGLTLVGEPYAILIGVVAGILDLIPYVGPVIASIPAFIIGFSSGGIQLALWVLFVFVVANQAEGHLIAPNIVSRTIKLSPSSIVLAVLIGGELYGVPGMFIAVPVAGIIRVLLLHVIPGSVSREEARPVLTKDSRETVEADAQAGEA